MKTSQKGFISPLLLASLPPAAGGGAYVYVQNKQVNNRDGEFNDRDFNGTDFRCSNCRLKTYTNTRFGFEVKYPSDWSGNQLGNKDAYYGGDQYQLNNNKDENVHYSFYISSEMKWTYLVQGK